VKFDRNLIQGELMQKFKENINETNFFWWDKELIKSIVWRGLPPASKTVFPVIVCHCNKNGIAFPSEGTISALCGRTEKTVRKGINGLDVLPNLHWERYVTKTGHYSRKFYYTRPNSRERGRCFPFYKWIIESGIWRELKPTAQALYPVMRYFAFFDKHIRLEFYDIEIRDSRFYEHYINREFDYCDAEKDILAYYAGINENSLSSALDSLEENCLIESISSRDWKVYLKSKNMTYFDREDLNSEINETG
jgi:hypothetical protein